MATPDPKTGRAHLTTQATQATQATHRLPLLLMYVEPWAPRLRPAAPGIYPSLGPWDLRRDSNLLGPWDPGTPHALSPLLSY